MLSGSNPEAATAFSNVNRTAPNGFATRSYGRPTIVDPLSLSLCASVTSVRAKTGGYVGIGFPPKSKGLYGNLIGIPQLWSKVTGRLRD
jgi:hypothetical protein